MVPRACLGWPLGLPATSEGSPVSVWGLLGPAAPALPQEVPGRPKTPQGCSQSGFGVAQGGTSSSLAMSPSRAGWWLRRVTRVPWVPGASTAARTHLGLPPPSQSGLGILQRGAPRATPQPLSPGCSGTGDSSLLSRVASTQKFYPVPLPLILTPRPCSGTRGWHLPGAAALYHLLIGPCRGIWVARALCHPPCASTEPLNPPQFPRGGWGTALGSFPWVGCALGSVAPVSCGIIPCPRGCPRVCPRVSPRLRGPSPWP